jgi:phosphatidylserine/phosphatidylglycerophosphate/cardiolipin synthase-like enzyme
MASPLVVALAKIVVDRLGSSSTKGRRSKSSQGFSLIGGKFRWLMILLTLGGAVYYFGTDRVKQWVLQQIPEARPILEAGKQVFSKDSIQVYFTNPPGSPDAPGNPAAACAGLIDQARESLDVAAFELNNEVIVKALVKAHQRGVKVRLVTDSDYMDAYGPEQFQLQRIPVVEDHREALMHNKFIVFDNKAVWMGSMNFTENCAYKNNNHALYIPIAELAQNYSTKFKWMFEQGVFGKAPAGGMIPHPVIELSDGTKLENYFATHDRCAEHINETVAAAKNEIDFLAFSFTHELIGQTMLDRARAGVKIRGVFEKSQAGSKYSEFHTLRKAGLSVYTDGNPRNMHHKAMMIDGDTTICGSFNFSSSADKSNDENLLIIHRNPRIYGEFRTEFEKVYEIARTAQ